MKIIIIWANYGIQRTKVFKEKNLWEVANATAEKLRTIDDDIISIFICDNNDKVIESFTKSNFIKTYGKEEERK